MKNNKRSVRTLLSVLLVALAMFATACGSDDDVTDTTTGADPTETPDGDTGDGADGDGTDQGDGDEGDGDEGDGDEGDGAGDGDEGDGDGDEGDGAMTGTIERFWVGPELVDCVGVGPQKCMLIRRSEDGQIEFFYDSIDGFTHEAGITYVLDVEVTDRENPPADASSLQYRLVEIVESDATPVSDRIDGTSWALLGFRDGDLFDEVPDGVEVTLQFDGDRASGSSGCNTYSGTFTADGSNLTFGPLAGTRKACVGPQMEVEDRFLPLIGTTETASIGFDGTLLLTNPTGPNLLFAPAG